MSTLREHQSRVGLGGAAHLLQRFSADPPAESPLPPRSGGSALPASYACAGRTPPRRGPVSRHGTGRARRPPCPASGAPPRTCRGAAVPEPTTASSAPPGPTGGRHAGSARRGRRLPGTGRPGSARPPARSATFDQRIRAHGFTGLLIIRLLPLFPFNAVNFGCGLTGIRLRDYVLATAIGIVPGTFVYQFLFAKFGRRILTEGFRLEYLSDPQLWLALSLFAAFVIVGKWLSNKVSPK